MTVWIVWEGSHEEIAVVCATEVIARQWVKDKAEETRKWMREETARRIAAQAELRAMSWPEQLRIMGMPGHGEPTLEERIKYVSFNSVTFWNPDDVREESWPVEEAQVLEASGG